MFIRSLCHLSKVITFDLRTKYSSKSSTRKLCSYKKDKLAALDRELKSVKWDQHLTFCDPETTWSHFKKIVFFHVDKNIPTATIKNQGQPSWYNSDLHDLCHKEHLKVVFYELDRLSLKCSASLPHQLSNPVYSFAPICCGIYCPWASKKHPHQVSSNQSGSIILWDVILDPKINPTMCANFQLESG